MAVGSSTSPPYALRQDNDNSAYSMCPKDHIFRTEHFCRKGGACTLLHDIEAYTFGEKVLRITGLGLGFARHTHAKNATAACFSLFLAQYSRSW